MPEPTEPQPTDLPAHGTAPADSPLHSPAPADGPAHADGPVHKPALADGPVHRPALAGRAPVEGPGIRLEPLPEGHLLQVIGAPDVESIAACLPAAGFAASGVRSAGYRQWYVAGDAPAAAGQLAALSAALSGKARVTDQSHGRVRIGLFGPAAAGLLATGTAVDLDPSVFPEGRSAVTLFGHISVQLTRTGPQRFELTVLRSFAEDLYDLLAHGLPHPAPSAVG